MRRPLALLALTVALAACSRPEPLTEVQIDRLQIPDVLLTCAEAPEIPPKPRDRDALGRYIIALHEAHADCLAKLEAVRSLAK